MILNRNITRTPLEQLIISVFLISRALLSGISEENLRADLPIKTAHGRGDIYFLSARKVKRVSNPFCTVLMRVTRKILCENRRKKRVFRIFRRIFQSLSGLTDAHVLSGSDAVFYI
ncbi:MAG: hypothetical protein BWK80_22640 [Desulfobacteraceae bacterium IS3]|nr:MAG: hypothetical protein BWK80_22640 [Desulfobacteraceae bacterium IS3]